MMNILFNFENDLEVSLSSDIVRKSSVHAKVSQIVELLDIRWYWSADRDDCFMAGMIHEISGTPTRQIYAHLSQCSQGLLARLDYSIQKAYKTVTTFSQVQYYQPGSQQSTAFRIPVALMSLAFTKPPLDGSLSLLDIISSHGVHSFRHPLFKYVDAGGNIHVIFWGDAIKAFNLATQYTMKNVGSSYLGGIQSTATSSPPPVIGILASLGLYFIKYFLVIASLIE